MSSTVTIQTVARRRKGEGTIARHHNHPSCPSSVDGKVPDHACKGGYRALAWVEAMNGKRVRKSVYGKTEREVLGKLKKLSAAEENRMVVASSMSVHQWLRTDAAELGIQNWWTKVSPGLKVNTRKGYVSKVNTYLIPHLGKHRLDKLTPAHVEAMYTAMRKDGLAETTLRGTHAILRRALVLAQRQGLVAVNICAGAVEPPSSKPRTQPRPLSVEDAWKVLRAAGDEPRYWLALLSGVRQGEALGLRWTDVYLDGDDPYLVVREAVSREPGVGLVFDTPKSDESTDRAVPLVTPVAARLRVKLAHHLAGGGSLDDLVFPNPRTGGPLDARADWLGWTLLLQRAGVPHIKLHAARNTTAALLEDAGVQDRVVADILGHAQVSMTHHYQKGNLRAKVAGMRALDAYLAAQAEEVPALEAPGA